MALVTCPDCSTQVSDQAPACPRCGRPLQAHAGAQMSMPPMPPMPPMQHGQPMQPMQPVYMAGAPKKSGLGTVAIIAIVAALVIIPLISIFAVLSIYGTRKYIANAKTAEARNALGQIARDAVAAYEREDIDSPLGNKPIEHRICPSASAAVPANRNAVSGKKYQSSTSEWSADASTHAGFSCLKFEMGAPQYFQYEYIATATGFTARAHGDLNGDGVFSTFEIQGQVVAGQLVISPSISETNPAE